MDPYKDTIATVGYHYTLMHPSMITEPLLQYDRIPLAEVDMWMVAIYV